MLTIVCVDVYRWDEQCLLGSGSLKSSGCSVFYRSTNAAKSFDRSQQLTLNTTGVGENKCPDTIWINYYQWQNYIFHGRCFQPLSLWHEDHLSKPKTSPTCNLRGLGGNDKCPQKASNDALVLSILRLWMLKIKWLYIKGQITRRICCGWSPKSVDTGRKRELTAERWRVNLPGPCGETQVTELHGTLIPTGVTRPNVEHLGWGDGADGVREAFIRAGVSLGASGGRGGETSCFVTATEELQLLFHPPTPAPPPQERSWYVSTNVHSVVLKGKGHKLCTLPFYIIKTHLLRRKKTIWTIYTKDSTLGWCSAKTGRLE